MSLLNVDAYEAKGDLVMESERSVDKYTFRVRYSDCLWHIRIEPEKSLLKNGIEYFEYGYDGDYTYSYTRYIVAQGQNEYNTSSGIIEQCDIPSETSVHGAVIWLALCSMCYFEKTSDSEMRYLFKEGVEMSLATKGKLQKYERTISPTSPHFLLSAQFFSDGNFYSRLTNMQFSVEKEPKPYDAGYKNATFKVNGFTNVQNCSFPCDFETVLYIPNSPYGKSTNDLITVAKWKGHVNFVDPSWHGVKNDFVPVTDGATVTIDKRFPAKLPNYSRIEYFNTNRGVWLTYSNKLVQDANRFTQGGPRIRKKSHPVVGVFVFLLLTAIPVVLYTMTRFNKWHEK